ncbi:MAG: glycoside hydrolase family 15 protein [Alphaproteobacteria bacterium]|nr:glycoside hydrolase family 15 protein [Alphaproteobacteria bacterium]
MKYEISDYGMIGSGLTAALVHRSGSIDWLCWPRFDSEACFAALLGDSGNGCWEMAPEGGIRKSSRRYQGDTLILETELAGEGGVAALIDFMPVDGDLSHVVRIVEGREGTVRMRSRLNLRFEYGRISPLIREHSDEMLTAVAGPNGVAFFSDSPVDPCDGCFTTEFTVSAGERKAFVLTYFPSHQKPPEPLDAETALEDTRRYWDEFAGRCDYEGPYRDAVVRSLITLKALVHRPTGGVLAAPTASLPEWPGGSRNWDYRFCWLRDSTFTMLAFLHLGLVDEAKAWADWLLRTAAGQPASLRPLYRLDGGRHMHEWEADWLSGFAESRPVRFGNAAGDQLQLDIYGELIETFHFAREHGLKQSDELQGLERLLIHHLEKIWECPDAGMWEGRGKPRHHTLSKVMAWTAFDRFSSRDDLDENEREHWRKVADQVRRRVLDEGYDGKRHTFVRAFDERELDASALRIPLVGFLPPDDERVLGTVRAVETTLSRDGFVHRYETSQSDDGMNSEQEGAFLACSFWLADNYALLGRQDEARKLIERVISMSNDLGLLAEELEPSSGRLLGNFPQAFSHYSLINAVANLRSSGGPAGERRNRGRQGSE